MSESKGARRPSKRVLEALAEGLDQVKDHFIWESFSGDGSDVNGAESTDQSLLHPSHGANSNSKGEDSGTDELNQANTEDQEEYYPTSFDREDVEVAIDKLVSQLIREKLVDKTTSLSSLSLSRVIASLFGQDHFIVGVATRFEKHIKGYFGAIDYDEMRAAYNDLLELKNIVSKNLEVARA